jgi:hypothetical protein
MALALLADVTFPIICPIGYIRIHKLYPDLAVSHKPLFTFCLKENIVVQLVGLL